MQISSVFYDSLRALGPIETQDVPDALANQLVASGFDGDAAKAKEAIAIYARLASKGTFEEFTQAVNQNGLTYLAEAESAAPKSCCGHTWEGTCTAST